MLCKDPTTGKIMHLKVKRMFTQKKTQTREKQESGVYGQGIKIMKRCSPHQQLEKCKFKLVKYHFTLNTQKK